MVKKFTAQVPEMRRYQSRIVVILIDFDCKTKGTTPEKRFYQVTNEIPEDLRSRTFVLGTLVEPENQTSRIHYGTMTCSNTMPPN